MPNDDSDIMVLGALACPEHKKRQVYDQIREIKRKNGMDSMVEIKWTKTSNSKIKMLEELIDYFFTNEDLSFRGIVARNKKQLDHERYNNGEPDLWYYKMYYLLLDKFCFPNNQYTIFIDVKDTKGGPRVRKLNEVLSNNAYDFKKEAILDIQQVDSSRSDLLQVTDLFIGALAFYHRGFYKNEESSGAKKQVVDKLISYIGDDIRVGTRLLENKFNVFIWNPRGGV